MRFMDIVYDKNDNSIDGSIYLDSSDFKMYISYNKIWYDLEIEGNIFSKNVKKEERIKKLNRLNEQRI